MGQINTYFSYLKDLCRNKYWFYLLEKFPLPNGRGSDFLVKLPNLMMLGIIGFCAFIITFVSHASSIYPLDTAKKEAQFEYLLKDLRCLVCQNQDLADSNADLAKDLRLEVYQLVKDGKSDTEIIEYLTSRYGDFILFKPPVKGVTLLLWFGPLLFLLLGFFIFWRTCFKRVSYE